MDRREYTVTEGSSIQLAITLSRETEQAVTVEVRTFDITAQGMMYMT